MPSWCRLANCLCIHSLSWNNLAYVHTQVYPPMIYFEINCCLYNQALYFKASLLFYRICISSIPVLLKQWADCFGGFAHSTFAHKCNL